MRNSEAIERLSPADPIVGVRGISEFPERFEEVCLDFESGTLIVACNPDTDELVLGWSGRAVANRTQGIEIRALNFITGMKPQLIWRMFNNLGYEDALQIRFFTPEGDRDQVDLQFECAASAVSVCRLIELTSGEQVEPDGDL